MILASSDRIDSLVSGEKLIGFGPKTFVKESVWKRIRFACKAFNISPSKEIAIALIGVFDEDTFVVTDHMILPGFSNQNSSSYSPTDLKKIEKEISKENLMIGGILHTHPSNSVTPSEDDNKTWISTLIDFGHPVYFFIYAPGANKISSFAVPFKLWSDIKEAVKPIEVALSE